MKFTVHFDGGCRLSKGIAAGAAVIFDEHGNELGTQTQLLRGVTTPIAEYTGLHIGLQLAARTAGLWTPVSHVTVWGDAELIVRQVDGRYQCRKPALKAMLDMAHLLMQPFASCQVKEFPKAGPHRKRRWGNERADQLAGECMDAALEAA